MLHYVVSIEYRLVTDTETDTGPCVCVCVRVCVRACVCVCVLVGLSRVYVLNLFFVLSSWAVVGAL